MSQMHENSEKIRIPNFKPTVLEVYLEFSNETGTVGKLCVSLLSHYTTRFMFPTRFQFSIRRNLQRHSLKNGKLTVSDQFSEHQ